MKVSSILSVPVLLSGLIVGVLAVLAVLSVTSARSQARDAVRLSDVRQTQLSLELYFNDVSEYPVSNESIALGVPTTACLGSDGFRPTCGNTSQTVYQTVVSAPPKAGLSKLSTCGSEANAYCYQGTEDAYRITFELEKRNRVLGLQKGLNCATPSGLSAGTCAPLTAAE